MIAVDVHEAVVEYDAQQGVEDPANGSGDALLHAAAQRRAQLAVGDQEVVAEGLLVQTVHEPAVELLVGLAPVRCSVNGRKVAVKYIKPQRGKASSRGTQQ